MLLFLLIEATAGCGANQVVLEVDYDSPALADTSLRQPELEVLSVEDARDAAPMEVGSAHTGALGKRVPALLPEPVADVVLGVMQRVLGPVDPDSPTTPLRVVVDTLLVAELGNLASERAFARCSMRFAYPRTDGSTAIVSAGAEATRTGVEVTSLLDDALMAALASTAREFLQSGYDPARAIRDEPGRNASTRFPAVRARSHPALVAASPAAVSAGRASRHGASLGLLVGDRISVGFQLGYWRDLHRPAGRWDFSSGVGMHYLNVRNEGLWARNGYYLAFGIPLEARWHLRRGRPSGFASAAVELLGGPEASNVGGRRSSYTAILVGGMFRPSLGLTTAGGTLVEISGYALRVIGSNLNPEDVGGRLSLRVPFGL